MGYCRIFSTLRPSQKKPERHASGLFNYTDLTMILSATSSRPQSWKAFEFHASREIMPSLSELVLEHLIAVNKDGRGGVGAASESIKWNHLLPMQLINRWVLDLHLIVSLNPIKSKRFMGWRRRWRWRWEAGFLMTVWPAWPGVNMQPRTSIVVVQTRTSAADHQEARARAMKV